jgi:hypothetical protein
MKGHTDMNKEPQLSRRQPEVDDRRQHQRIEPEGATVEVAVMGQPVTFDIDNLSEGGALIAGRVDVPLGAVVDMLLRLPDASPIATSGRVLRHMPRGGKEFTAVVFQQPSDDLRSWISEIVLQGLKAAFPEL